MPPRADTFHTDRITPQTGYHEAISFNLLDDIVTKAIACINALDLDERKEREMKQDGVVHNISHFRWAKVEREYPLFQVCHDFIGNVVPQMFCGLPPEDVRLIAWVT